MSKNHEGAWESCLKVIKDNISLQAFKTWFEPIVPIKLEKNVLTIQVPSYFFYEWLEENYITLLRKVVKKQLGRDGSLEYSIVMENNNKTSNPYTVKIPAHSSNSLKNSPVNVPISGNEKQIRNPFVIPGIRNLKIDSQLNPNYNFNNFLFINTSYSI